MFRMIPENKVFPELSGKSGIFGNFRKTGNLLKFPGNEEFSEISGNIRKIRKFLEKQESSEISENPEVREISGKSEASGK